MPNFLSETKECGGAVNVARSTRAWRRGVAGWHRAEPVAARAQTGHARATHDPIHHHMSEPREPHCAVCSAAGLRRIYSSTATIHASRVVSRAATVSTHSNASLRGVGCETSFRGLRATEGASRASRYTTSNGKMEWHEASSSTLSRGWRALSRSVASRSSFRRLRRHDSMVTASQSPSAVQQAPECKTLEICKRRTFLLRLGKNLLMPAREEREGLFNSTRHGKRGPEAHCRTRAS
jgi:hypothetical protein